MKHMDGTTCVVSALSGDAHVTQQEYAQLAGVKIRTIKRWAAQGVGPRPFKIGPKFIRYHRSEVLQYLHLDEVAV